VSAALRCGVGHRSPVTPLITCAARALPLICVVRQQRPLCSARDIRMSVVFLLLPVHALVRLVLPLSNAPRDAICVGNFLAWEVRCPQQDLAGLTFPYSCRQHVLCAPISAGYSACLVYSTFKAPLSYKFVPGCTGQLRCARPLHFSAHGAPAYGPGCRCHEGE